MSGSFRYYARDPWPQEVPEAFPMARDGDGLWTHETAPLEPGFYTYGFRVDGVPVVDPRTRTRDPWGSHVALVPGRARAGRRARRT